MVGYIMFNVVFLIVVKITKHQYENFKGGQFFIFNIFVVIFSNFTSNHKKCIEHDLTTWKLSI